MRLVAFVLLALLLVGWAALRWGSLRSILVGAGSIVGGCGLAIWLYSQRSAPEPPPCALPSAIGELGFVCGFRNPEDLEYVASLGVILVSEEGFGGRVLALRPDDLDAGPSVLWPPPMQGMPREQPDPGDAGCRPTSDPSRFGPHGLSSLERAEAGAPVRVALVAHRLRDGLVTDSVQWFDLTFDGHLALRWRGCIDYPNDVIGNDIAFLEDGSLVATNFAPRGTPNQLSRSVVRGALGFETGDVLTWSEERGWSHLPGTQGAIPNGIAVAPDGRSFFFADAGRRRVTEVPRGTAGEIFRIRVGGAPNNLSRASSGRILATVATLSGDIPFLCSIGGRRCRSGWAVWEIDPQTRSAVEILADDGRRLATATTALEVGDALLLGSMADDRVGVYRRR